MYVSNYGFRGPVNAISALTFDEASQARRLAVVCTCARPRPAPPTLTALLPHRCHMHLWILSIFYVVGEFCAYRASRAFVLGTSVGCSRVYIGVCLSFTKLFVFDVNARCVLLLLYLLSFRGWMVRVVGTSRALVFFLKRWGRTCLAQQLDWVSIDLLQSMEIVDFL